MLPGGGAVFLKQLQLSQFRSYQELDLSFTLGTNLLVGRNGQGKTNVVEAISYLATLRSHRVPSDAPLVHLGADSATINAVVAKTEESGQERNVTLSLQINPGKSNRAQINRAPARRARDILGITRVIMFAPEDLALVKGDPDGRRKFLDDVLVQLQPAAAGLLTDYDRIVRQRSSLLKSLSGLKKSGRLPADLSTLDVWDQNLVQVGGQIMWLRHRLVEALQPQVAEMYRAVSSDQGDAKISYLSSLARFNAEYRLPQLPGQVSNPEEYQELLATGLAQVRSREIERGVCLLGPHRDDLDLELGPFPAKGYASHGESWSFALALRLASWLILGGSGGEEVPQWAMDWGSDGDPILILDDVFAELDSNRRALLTELITTSQQTFITAAVAEDVPEQLQGEIFQVTSGAVARQ